MKGTRMPTKKLSEDATGVYIIAATPFTDDAELDLASTDSLTDFYLDKGVTGLTILGMMGEAPTLTESEILTVMGRGLKRVNSPAPIFLCFTHASNTHLESP